MTDCTILVSSVARSTEFKKGEVAGIKNLPQKFGRQEGISNNWLQITITDQTKRDMTFLQSSWRTDFTLDFISNTAADVQYRFQVKPTLVAPSGKGGEVLNDQMNLWFIVNYNALNVVGGKANRIARIPRFQATKDAIAKDFDDSFHRTFDPHLWFLTEAEVDAVVILGGKKRYTRAQADAVFVSKLSQ